MKARKVIFLSALVLMMNSCIVKSLHKFYFEDDVVFDEMLIGTWLDEDDTRWEIRQHQFSKGFMKGDSLDNSYLVELYEDSLDPVRFNVHLFFIDGNKYLDFLPIRDDRYDGLYDMHMIGSHSIAMINKKSDGEITISWFDEEWLHQLFEENRVKIAHEKVSNPNWREESEYVLTAGTGELQKFIRKYGAPEHLFACDDNDNLICVNLKRIP